MPNHPKSLDILSGFNCTYFQEKLSRTWAGDHLHLKEPCLDNYPRQTSQGLSPRQDRLSPTWWVSGCGCQREALCKLLPVFPFPVSRGLCADSYSHLGACRTETWVWILVFAFQIMHLKQEFQDSIKERLFTSSYSPIATKSQQWDFSFGFSHVYTEILQKICWDLMSDSFTCFENPHIMHNRGWFWNNSSLLLLHSGRFNWRINDIYVALSLPCKNNISILVHTRSDKNSFQSVTQQPPWPLPFSAVAVLPFWPALHCLCSAMLPVVHKQTTKCCWHHLLLGNLPISIQTTERSFCWDLLRIHSFWRFAFCCCPQ